MFLRAKTLASGRTGVRPVVLQTMVEVLNVGITPVVREFGFCLGCSGDLAPLSHCALVLMGDAHAPATTATARANRPNMLPPRVVTIMASVGAHPHHPGDLRPHRGLANRPLGHRHDRIPSAPCSAAPTGRYDSPDAPSAAARRDRHRHGVQEESCLRHRSRGLRQRYRDVLLRPRLGVESWVAGWAWLVTDPACSTGDR